MKFYVDGINYIAAHISSYDYGGTPENNALNVAIGMDAKNTRWPFKGIIDEVAIWNRSLSASEILNIYNRQKGKYIDQASYESKVFNSGTISLWKNLTWDEAVPYGEELPDNKAVDAVSGGANAHE
jgi:hypothetical protein